MRAGEQSNLEVNRDVRRVLVSQWVDLGQLSVHTLNDSVHIRGSLQKLPGVDSPLTATSIEAMFRKIKTAAGSRSMQVDFDNWSMNSATGTWEPITARDRRHKDAAREVLGKSSQTTFRIEED